VLTGAQPARGRVDGIHHEATLGNDRFLQRVTTLDVTPQALYDVSPFRDPPA